MSCCGQRRANWRESRDAVRASSPAPPSAPKLDDARTLRHLRDRTCLVVGEVTGIVYLFGRSDSVLDVDGRDVDALLATDRFAVAVPTPERVGLAGLMDR